MSTGPPFDAEDSDADWDEWRSTTTLLDYPDREIRIIFAPQHQGTVHNPKSQPADFGDFDPEPGDPDPDVWPLENYDPGHPADVDDLILLTNSFPAPHVAWVTPEYLEARYGYNPVRQEVEARELPKYARPEGAEGTDTVEIVATNEATNSMELTPDRLEALTRLARLWNGEVVQGQHLLLDKCPSWESIFGDLDQSELRRFVVDSDVRIAEAFGDHDWYEVQQDVYTKPQRILRKKVWYAPTQRGRTLVNNNSHIPDLIGDPNEGLAHRVSVGLAAVREIQRNHKFSTYHEDNGDVIDILSKSQDGEFYAGEIMTGHHNWKLHRRTHQKMRGLHNHGVTPYVVFDSRETAYEIFNHWQRKGLCELPGGTFGSDFSVSNGRDKVRSAYESEEFDWIVADWTTTSVLWRRTLGPDGPESNAEKIKSIDW